MKIIKIPNINEKIYEHTCKNGLKVYIWPYDLSEEVSMTLTVKYGSIHTEFSIDNKKVSVPNGTAHFLEHIKFNEKKNQTAHDYFYKLGSYTNAYTTYDHTCYEVVCNQNINDNLNHLLYFVYNPYFTNDLIEKEKSIIVEETKMSLNDPYNEGYLKLMEGLYNFDKHKYLITGREDEINQITKEDVLNVFNNFYIPSNMFLIVTGNVIPNEIARVVDKFFDKKKFNKPKVKLVEKKEPIEVVCPKQEIFNNVTKNKLLLSFKIPRNNFKDINDLDLRLLLRYILEANYGGTSIFNEKLLKKHLIDNLFYMSYVRKDYVIIMFESSTDYPDVISKMIKNKMKKLTLSKDTFNRKKKAQIASTILGFENAEAVNNDIRLDIIYYEKVINNIEEIINELTYEEAILIIKNIHNYTHSEVILKPQI